MAPSCLIERTSFSKLRLLTAAAHEEARLNCLSKHELIRSAIRCAFRSRLRPKACHLAFVQADVGSRRGLNQELGDRLQAWFDVR